MRKRCDVLKRSLRIVAPFIVGYADHLDTTFCQYTVSLTILVDRLKMPRTVKLNCEICSFAEEVDNV